MGIGFTLFRERESGNGTKVVLSDGTGNAKLCVRASWPFLEAMRGESYRRLFYPRRPVTLASPIVATLPPMLRLGWRSLLSLGGVSDVFGLLGYPAPGWTFTVSIAVGREHEVTPQLRAALHRVRIHVESGLRLRLCSPESAVAVLSPSGKILDLARGAGTEEASERLGD